MPLPPGPHTALYPCRVWHHRLSPKVHQFTYHLFLFALDLDELDATAARVRGFSHNRWNLYTFRDRDHLTLPGLESASTKENILAWIASQGLTLPENPRVVLLTLPRVLGYIFNPVSFFFLHDRATDLPLCAVVQVGNTFREMKPYLLRAPASQNHFRLITPKHFYVSPFSPLDLHFDFQLDVPSDLLNIAINDRDGPDGPPILLSSLTGRRRPLTTRHLLALTLHFPFVTLKVIALIHWQALLLWLRRLPFHRKADHPELQQNVFPPPP